MNQILKDEEAANQKVEREKNLKNFQLQREEAIEMQIDSS